MLKILLPKPLLKDYIMDVQTSLYNSNIIAKMQFSEIIESAKFCRISNNGAFFAYYDAKKIYIKETSLNLNNFAVISTPVAVTDLFISPNSLMVAAFYKQKNLLIVYNLEGHTVAKIQQNQLGVSGMVWSPDSLRILVFSQFLYRCSIYNLQDRSISHIRNPKLSSSKGCIFNSDGKLMALLQKHDCKDIIGIYFTGDWTLMNSIVLQSFDVGEIKWNQNDSHIVAWERPLNYRVYGVCPFKGVMFRYQAYEYALGIKSLQCSNRSQLVAAGSFDQKIRIINAKTWKFVAELDCSNPIISSDYTKIYKEEDNPKSINKMRLIDRTQYKLPIIKPSTNETTLPVQGIGLLEFSHDDTFLACRNDNMPYTVWIWNVARLQLQTVLSLNSQVKMVKWDKFENRLCVVSGTQKVLFWNDGSILECTFPIDNRKFNIQRFLWSQDCTKMILFDKTEAIYADLRRGQ